MDGRRLRFRLAGINNQNFIMRDEETGTWWQQVTGCAILGPLAGRCLERVACDEVTFAVWKEEQPGTLILSPLAAAKKRYASADWETKILERPTVTPVDPRDPLEPRDLVVGVRSGTAAMAYPWSALAERGLIADVVGGTPLLILLHPDGRSLRCFDRRVDGSTIDPSLERGTGAPVVVDAGTGSRWGFSGLATSGPLAGRRLEHVACLKDFWFDWKIYNPDTGVFLQEGPGSGGPAQSPAE